MAREICSSKADPAAEVENHPIILGKRVRLLSLAVLIAVVGEVGTICDRPQVYRQELPGVRDGKKQSIVGVLYGRGELGRSLAMSYMCVDCAVDC